VLLLILSLVAGLSAQTFQGRIVGRVTDATGAVVPNAKVTITNTGTDVKRVLETNAAGDYAAPNLNPGVYSITVEAASFQTVKRIGVRLEVATSVAVDFSLKPGAVSELIEVTGEQPLIDTVTDTLGGTLTNKSINELPLQGRDFQNLLALRPGVQRTPGGGMLSITSNGNRVQDNNFMIDGADDNDIYYGDTVVNGAGVMGTPASHLPLDAIQEFNTQQNQGAEFGWKPGAVVNIGLKSGTNDLHGTTYYFHRNSALDARNYFNRIPSADTCATMPGFMGCSTSALLMHQFGASLGGPIIKDKWFFFGNYEGTRHKVGNAWLGASPVTTSLGGNTKYSIPDAIAACTAAGTCNPLSLKIANLFLPNPGYTADQYPQDINFNFNNVNREDNFVVKSEYNLNAKNKFAARYVYGNSHQIEEDTSPLRPEFLSYADTRVGVGAFTWTFTPRSNWVNDARFGVNRMWQHIDSVDSLLGADHWGINTGITNPLLVGMPQISISPFDYFGGNYNWPLLTTPNQTLQFSDNASWTHGSHNVQFGGEYRAGSTDYMRSRYGKGRVRFTSLENFMTGTVRTNSAGGGNLLVGDTHRNISMSALGGFIKDDWRITRRLSLSYGLRYDLTFPIKDSQDQIANFFPELGLVQIGKGVDAPYYTKYTNFSPRIGLAWDMFGTGKTVLRAGGALMFEQPSMRMFLYHTGLSSNPAGVAGVTPGNGTMNVFSKSLNSDQINWSLEGPIFNTSPGGSCSYDSPCDILGVAQNLKTPQVYSWNVNLQQQVTKTTTLQLAYVGNRGVYLYSHRDINQTDPAVTLANDWDEQAGRPFVNQYPWLGWALFIENLGDSNYHSFQATVTQKAWKGLDFLAGYTWAHAIDVGTSNTGGYPQDSWNIAADRGSGDYDIRHRFTFSATYNVPKFNAPLQLGNGWQLTTITTMEGGMPFSFVDGGDDMSATGEYTDRWNLYGNPSAIQASATTSIPWYDSSAPICQQYLNQYHLEDTGAGCFAVPGAVIIPPGWGKFGTMGRNIFRGPGFRNVDFSMSKEFKLSERFNMQFRAEVFNLLNHPNFDVAGGTLNTDLYSYWGVNDSGAPSGLGQLTSTPDVAVANPVIGSGGSRHIQFGLKLKW
jgi:hypothetical protein